MSKKIIALLLCLLMVTAMLVGCGSSSGTTNTDTETAETATTQSDTSDQSKSTESTKSNESASGQVKKVVVIQETDDEIRTKGNEAILETLKKEGFEDGKAAQITQIKLSGDEKKSTETVDKIKQIKPDVVIINSAQFAFKSIAKPLEGSGIPVVLNLNVENKALDYITEDGTPKNNITGLYTMPKDLQVNAFKFLQKICPTNGKKAVFITTEGRFVKDDVAKNLKEVGVELKDFCESKFVEDFQDAVNKYNKDDEVAWMLVGVWPGSKKDGSAISNLEFAKWDVANRKKPSVTYYEAAVKLGMLCGLGVDLNETNVQAAEMAIKILKGEDVKNIKAEAPRKINITLNQKNAQELKINFPADILGSAFRVYKDYEGHF